MRFSNYYIILLPLALASCGNAGIPVTTTTTATKEATAAATFTPLSTATSTTAPSPTPDTRVINIDPYQFLLTRDMLPKEGKYYLPASDWISPHRNSEVVSGWGVEAGRTYLAKTGRVDGWFVYYERGTIKFLGPEEVYDNVVLYKTSEGAFLVMTEFSTCAKGEAGFVLQETDLQIGDLTNVCILHEMQSSGVNREWYRIEFSYRNYYHTIEIYGWEYEIDPEFAKSVALSLLAELENAPLSSEVNFSP